MDLNYIQSQLQSLNIYHSNSEIASHPSVIGYDKQFRWGWMATQLNTFIFATDLGDTPIVESTIQAYEGAAFQFASQNYKGWPRGFQSGLGVIAILISENVSREAAGYCQAAASGKKWAGFSVPVVVDTSQQHIHHFAKTPMWGAIYYPYFNSLIAKLLL